MRNCFMKSRNTSFDVFKGFACIGIVLMHSKFPEPAGTGFRSLACFGVPLFFSISGYYLSSKEPRLASEVIKYRTARQRSWNDKNYSIKLRDGYNYKAGNEMIKRAIDAKIGNLISVEIPAGTTSETFAARVTATEYDCLQEKYTSITLGEKLESFSRMLAKDIKR